MNRVKWFTQRITMILSLTLGLLVLPYALAQVLELTTIRAWIDNLYHSGTVVIFWVIFVISRLAFSAAWFGAWYKFVDFATKAGYLWFKPDYYRRDEPSVDQSGTIVFGIAVVIIAIFIAEFAIRIYTWTDPSFYLPESAAE